MKSFSFFPMLVFSTVGNAADIGDHPIAVALDRYDARFAEYATRVADSAETICSSTFLSTSGVSDFNYRSQCEQRVRAKSHKTLRALAKQSRSSFKTRHEENDIAVEEGINSYGDLQRKLEFFKDFPWERYPTIGTLHDLYGSKDRKQFSSSTCTWTCASKPVYGEESITCVRSDKP